MKKIIFRMFVVLIGINAFGLTRYYSVETYMNYDYNTKATYLKGVDSLYVELSRSYGKNNNLSSCMRDNSEIRQHVYIYDDYLSKLPSEYKDYSAAELYRYAISKHCNIKLIKQKINSIGLTHGVGLFEFINI